MQSRFPLVDQEGPVSGLSEDAAFQTLIGKAKTSNRVLRDVVAATITETGPNR